MKIFLVGADNEYAIENFYVKYLRQAGEEVFHFPAQSLFNLFYDKGIGNKLLYRAGLSKVLHKINKLFKEKVELFKPDVIWVFKGMEIFPESLKWARNNGIKLVNFNGDSPFIFSGRGSGNKNVTRSIGMYDLFLTYSFVDRETMESKFKVRSALLPFGFDVSDELYNECVKQEEKKKVCFIGNADKNRANFIKELANSGVTIDVYGSFWNRYPEHPNVSLFEPVKGDEFWRTLRKYRVQLNLMRPHNPTTHNMRTFESGGIGAIQLASDTPDHRQYFQNEEEIFLFESLDECLQKINFIMNLEKGVADKVRENTRRRAVEDGYSYECRTMNALENIKKL